MQLGCRKTLPVCVCVCVYIYMYIYACMHACMHVCNYVRRYIHTHDATCMYMHVNIHIYDYCYCYINIYLHTKYEDVPQTTVVAFRARALCYVPLDTATCYIPPVTDFGFSKKPCVKVANSEPLLAQNRTR